VWDASTGQHLLTLKGHTDRVWSVTYSPDGRRLASASEDKTVKVWDASSGQDLLTLQGHTGPVNSVAYSPDGRRIASASHDQTVKLWDASTGQDLLALKGHTGVVFSVAYSPDGRRLASATWDTVKVWDASTGQDLLSLKGHTIWVTSVAYSPDGRRIASSGSDDQTVKVWDASTGQDLLFKGHTQYVSSVTYSPDGRRIASGSADDTVKVWDASTAQDLLTLKGHTASISAVCFSADHKRLASGSDDRTVKLWDAVAGQELLTLKGHTEGVTSVCFSPDGKRLASGSGIADPVRMAYVGGEVKIWNSATGRELLLPQVDGDATVTSVGFSADGKRVIARSDKGKVHSWDAATGQGVVPCTDPPPVENKEAINPARTLRVTVEEGKVCVRRLRGNRASSDLVFAGWLNARHRRLVWHRSEAAASERSGQWFAAAHHLRQLLRLAGPADNAAALRVRLLRALTVLDAVRPDALRKAVAGGTTDKVTAPEAALAYVYHALDWPAHAVPWWLGRDAHATLLFHLRAAEAQLLQARRPPPEPGRGKKTGGRRPRSAKTGGPARRHPLCVGGFGRPKGARP
jgi:WD40 repeat protein